MASPCSGCKCVTTHCSASSTACPAAASAMDSAQASPGFPHIPLNNWGPIPGIGTSYLGPLPATYGTQEQEAHTGKIKVSQQRRRIRHWEFSMGKTVVEHIKDNRGGKLRDAVSAENEEAVEKMLSSGTDANVADSKLRTPLHIAAAKGNEKIVCMLLDHGADTNAQDTIGNTPLHLASCTSQVPVITLLLNAGTDLSCLDKNGRTPLHLARGRLLLLQEDMSYSNEQLRTQVTQVVDMIRAYMTRQQQQKGAKHDDELDLLCEAFAKTSTREEVVDQVGNLLAHLDIQREKTQGDGDKRTVQEQGENPKDSTS